MNFVRRKLLKSQEIIWNLGIVIELFDSQEIITITPTCEGVQILWIGGGGLNQPPPPLRNQGRSCVRPQVAIQKFDLTKN